MGKPLLLAGAGLCVLVFAGACPAAEKNSGKPDAKAPARTTPAKSARAAKAEKI